MGDPQHGHELPQEFRSGGVCNHGRAKGHRHYDVVTPPFQLGGDDHRDRAPQAVAADLDLRPGLEELLDVIRDAVRHPLEPLVEIASALLVENQAGLEVYAELLEGYRAADGNVMDPTVLLLLQVSCLYEIARGSLSGPGKSRARPPRESRAGERQKKGENVDGVKKIP